MATIIDDAWLLLEELKVKMSNSATTVNYYFLFLLNIF